MSFRYDATLKDILTPQPEEFVPAFRLPTIKPAVGLNVDLSTLSAATDVAIGFGKPLQEIADLNFQSGPDPDVPARCHLYSAALHFRYKVPVRTLLILLRPKAETVGLDGKLAYFSGSSGVEFSYEVVRIWKEPIEPFLKGGLHLLPLATLCQLPEDRSVADALRDVVREIDRRLVEECEHAQAVRLMTAAFVLTGLRVRQEKLGPIYEGVRVMHETVAWDYYEEIGGIRTAHRLLLFQGKQRLGPPDASVVAALKSIKDLDRLERLAGAVMHAATWEELLVTP
jgi:hypothetical protein